ncbi:MAG: ATP-binding protein [Magnetovibrionaceae bacterium]
MNDIRASDGMVILGSRIGRRVLILILVFSSIVTIALTTFQLYMDFRHEVSTIEARFGEIERSRLDSLAHDLWSLDTEALDVQLAGILQLPDMQAVEIREASTTTENPLVLKGGNWRDQANLSRTFPISINNDGNSETIGELRVQATLEGVYARLIDKALVILASQAVKTFLVSLFILFVVHRLITRHLTTISNFVAGYSLEGEQAGLQLNRKRPREPDEFERVALAINTMQGNLRKTYTQLRDTHRELEIRKERFDLCLEFALCGVWEWDLKSDRVYASPLFWKMLGFSDDHKDAPFDNFLDHIHPDDRSRVKEHLNILIALGGPLFVEHRVVMADGSTHWVVERADVTRTDGKATSVLGVVAEITERKKVEQQILKAKEDAEKASAAKSQFLASMSHELRTPLNAVLGFAQMLELDLDHNLSAQQQEYIADILAGANQLLSLVNDLLDLARIEEGQIGLNLETVDAQELIRTCLDYTHRLSQENGITLTDKITLEQEAVIRTDKVRFQQILLNLLSNAVKFNQPGGSVTVTAEINGGGFLVIAVADTGCGISEDKQPRLFELFQRSDMDAYLASEGTGVGLRVAKLLAERLGGWISFDSKVGEGSTFRVAFPLADNRETLIWTKDWRIDIDVIDRDHQTLCTLANQASRLSGDEVARLRAFKRALDFNAAHMERELTYLGHDAEAKTQIQSAYQAFSKRADRLQERLAFGEDREAEEALARLLRDWVKTHCTSIRWQREVLKLAAEAETRA